MDLLVRALLPLALLGTFLFNVHFGRLTSLAADPLEALSGATAAPAQEVVAPTSPRWIDASSAGLSEGPDLPMPETPEALPVSVAFGLGACKLPPIAGSWRGCRVASAPCRMRSLSRSMT